MLQSLLFSGDKQRETVVRDKDNGKNLQECLLWAHRDPVSHLSSATSQRSESNQ